MARFSEQPAAFNASESGVIPTDGKTVDDENLLLSDCRDDTCDNGGWSDAGSLESTPAYIFQKTDPAFLYAVRVADDDYSPVKFGISVSPDERFRKLQTGMAYKMVTLALVSGGRALELAIHRLLQPWNTHGEWFASDTCQITKFAKQLKREPVRAAILKWEGYPSDLKRRARQLTGTTENAKWLAFLIANDGTELPALVHFIESCAALAPAPPPRLSTEGT